jgi:hypothetical protein
VSERVCPQCRAGAHDHCVCTDCELCAHRFDHVARAKALDEAEKALIELLMTPIKLIPMTPTKEKEARDDMRYGMQRALAVVRALKSPG